MPTIKDIDEAWAEFTKYTETAEQHEIVGLFMIQRALEPYHVLLHEEWDAGKWDEKHAVIWLNAFDKMFYKGFLGREIENG